MKDNDRENMFGELIGNLRELPKEEQKKFIEKLRESIKIPLKKEDEYLEKELKQIDESIESIQKKDIARKHIEDIKKILNKPKK